MRAREGDDMIFIDKTSQLDGVVDAQGGNDTVLLLNRATAEATVIVESDAERVLTLKTPNTDTTLTLINVEHLIGARQGSDELHLRCGLDSVNLRGGTWRHDDFINVDIDKSCPNNVSLVLEQFTYVNHKNGHSKVTYKFIEGPAHIYVDYKEAAPNDGFVIATGYDLTELQSLSIKPLLHNTRYIGINFGGYNQNRSRLLKIYNFYDSLTITFNDGYHLYAKNGQFYMGRDCSIRRQKTWNQLDGHVYKLLHNQKVIFTEKCPDQQSATLVYTGIVVDKFQEDGVLPDKFLQLYNDPQAVHTRALQDPVQPSTAYLPP